MRKKGFVRVLTYSFIFILLILLVTASINKNDNSITEENINSISGDTISTSIDEETTQQTINSNVEGYMPSFDGNNIIFIRQNNIYSIKSDGTNLQQLTFDGTYEKYPIISPNKNELVYYKDGDLWRINTDETNDVKLTQKNPENTTWVFNSPSWGEVNNKIYYEQEGEIWSIDSNGQNKIKLTEKDPLNKTYYDSYKDPTISLQEDKIVYINNRMVNLMNIDGSNQQQITFRNPSNSSEIYMNPSISPDGNKILFLYKKNVYKLEPEKDGEWLYVHGNNSIWFRNQMLQIPEGKWAYNGLEGRSVYVDGAEAIGVMDINGRNKVILTERIPEDFIQSFNSACWLSDDEIVFEKNMELYKMNIIDKSIIQLTFKDESFIEGKDEWDSYPYCIQNV